LVTIGPVTKRLLLIRKIKKAILDDLLPSTSNKQTSEAICKRYGVGRNDSPWRPSTGCAEETSPGRECATTLLPAEILLL
jgi:hypothetical protein